MTNSRKIGRLRVRAFKRSGIATGQYYVDVPASLTSTGKRTRRLFDNQRQALEVVKRLARELEMRAYNLSKVPRRTGLSFDQTVSRWAADEEIRVRTRKKRRISLDTDMMRLKSAIAYFGDTDLSFVTERAIGNFQAKRLEQGRSPETVNSDVKSVLKVLKWAVKGKRLPELPTIEPIPVEAKTFKVPTDNDVVRLIEASPVRLRLLIWFLAETGCRSGEAFNLRWDDVDLSTGAISIRSKEGWTPKTKQSRRTIYIATGLLEALRSVQQHGGYVFPGRDPGQPIGSIKKAFATAVRKAGLGGLTPHSLRKAYASRYAMLGTPPRLLQANLGHSAGSRVTDQYYVFATEEARRQAVRPLPMPPRAGADMANSGNSLQKAAPPHRAA